MNAENVSILWLLIVIGMGASAWGQEPPLPNRPVSPSQSKSSNAASRARAWIAPAAKAVRAGSWYPPPVQIVHGNLSRFDHRGLVLRKDGESADSAYAATRVLWIERSNPNDSSQRLLQRYASGQFVEALSSLPPALASRPPVWRQQQLTMIAANAGCRSGREKIAFELIVQLDRRPIPALVLGWAPIAWTGYPLNASRRDREQDAAWVDAAWVDEAKQRLDDDSPLVSLVAASWLLSTSNRSEATAQLKKLMKNQDRPSIAALAYCVLWTTATPPQVKSRQTKWMQQLEQLPMPLQMGPMFALERKLRAAGETQSAESLTSSIEATPIAPHPLLIDRELTGK